MSTKLNSKLIPQDTRYIPIKKNGKYLVILPKDANIKAIAPALATFFNPTPVFVLAVNDVTDVKIAELLEEK